MSYLVLARKWRPQTFEQVIGQEHVSRTLKNAILTERLAHAFLFCGTRGVGKTSGARILAKAINCLDDPENAPCNKCSSCVEIDEGGSVDILEIDGASNRGIEEVRELRENVRYLPAKARRKVYIIDEVHMLTPPAFNALLKTLEEPPAHVVFIFATTEVHKVPATILSRCQRYDFRPIPPGRIKEHLEQITAAEGIDLDSEGAAVLARAAKGSMRDGLSLLDQTISFAGESITQEDVQKILGLVDPRLVSDLTEAILHADEAGVLAGVGRVDSHGYDLQTFFQEMVTHFRNLIVLKVEPGTGQDDLGLNETEIERMLTQAQGASPQTLQLCLQGLLDAERTVKFATQPRFAVELALLKLCHMVPVVGLDKIILKLEKLKDGLGYEPESEPSPEPVQKPDIVPPAEQTARPVPEPQSEPEHRPDQKPVSPDPEPGPGYNEPPPSDDDYYEPPSEDYRPPGGDFKDPQAHWPQFVSLVSGSEPSLGAILKKTSPVGTQKGKITLQVPAGFNLLEDPDRLRDLEARITDYFGRPLKVRIADAPRRATTRNKSNVDREALEHPLVQEAMSLFGGDLKRIIPISEQIPED